MKLNRILCSLLFDLFVIIKFRKFGKNQLLRNLSGAFIDGVKQKKVNLSWEKEIFYNEGLAFRAAAIASVLNDPCDLINNSNKSFKHLRYVGYGFWVGFSRHFFINKLIKNTEYIHSKNKSYSILIYDGQGFSSALFASKKKLQSMIDKSSVRSLKKTSMAIGYGRALWWRFMNGEEFNILSGEAREAILCGMTVAACVTQLTSKSSIEASMLLLISQYPSHEDQILNYKNVLLKTLCEQSPKIKEKVTGMYGEHFLLEKNYEDLSRDLFKAGKYSL